ncbi:hypothetical protein DPMN_073666 [Dreissena polymorpha]|uniref:Uncharacterized protein n=1 Tax=Dreissena polymorpha TaxID=45954 RepID=A0A9D4HEC4_DREPO|nr:hypothetical protein DPMN_073666 [Dreissena polymorpha]
MVRQEIELPWSCDQCQENPAADPDHAAVKFSAYEPADHAADKLEDHAADKPADHVADEPANHAADEDHAANVIHDNSFNAHGEIRERPHIEDGCH